jgi:hypothetical protein
VVLQVKLQRVLFERKFDITMPISKVPVYNYSDKSLTAVFNQVWIAVVANYTVKQTVLV